jgi:hypothetical protein
MKKETVKHGLHCGGGGKIIQAFASPYWISEVTIEQIRNLSTDNKN